MKKHLLLSISLLGAVGLVAAPPVAFAQAQAGSKTGVQSAPAQKPNTAQMQSTPAQHGSGHAQPAENPGRKPGQTVAVPQGQGQDQANAGPPDQGGQQEVDQGQQQAIPVRMITSVEVMRSAGQPTLDIVRVRGLTTSDGWGEPQLIAMGPADPADGILDLVLVAVPPSESVEANGAAPIEAIMPMEPGAPYKGVRVRAASNAVTLDHLPGVTEVQVPAAATASYVGKRFLSRGEAMPAGLAAGDVVREEDLPDDSRVIGPSSGVSDITSDPNRLTLLVGGDGRIQSAYWN